MRLETHSEFGSRKFAVHLCYRFDLPHDAYRGDLVLTRGFEY
jgi:hypothetical protein